MTVDEDQINIKPHKGIQNNRPAEIERHFYPTDTNGDGIISPSGLNNALKVKYLR